MTPVMSPHSGQDAARPPRSVLVTGARGFIGSNLVVTLRRQPGLEVREFDLPQTVEAMEELASRADLVIHLAGVNRPKSEGEFAEGNVDLTRRLCDVLRATGRAIPLILSSSTQAALDNPYGISKRESEEIVKAYQHMSGSAVRIYRFPNVFGKWSRPDYNTVVATFCHRISRGLPVQVNDPQAVVRFAYIDDVVDALAADATKGFTVAEGPYAEIASTHTIAIGELCDLLRSFKASRETRLLPDLSSPLVKHLYSTYLSFCDAHDLARPVDLKSDARGWLFELVKSTAAGQIFISTTRPGITRGNHYHDSKVEKFCVVQGQATIRFRSLLGGPVIEYAVDGSDIRVIDIPPGYAHSIENTGSSDLLTLFWACEVFDPERPDTYACEVAGLPPDVPPPTKV